MEFVLRGAWFCLILVHVAPALALFAPSMVTRLYDIAPTGDLSVLLIHRGALFLAVIAAAVFALIDPSSRRVASVVVAISLIGFLAVYARAGFPSGALRMIALVDAFALAPLAVVTYAAWRS